MPGAGHRLRHVLLGHRLAPPDHPLGSPGGSTAKPKPTSTAIRKYLKKQVRRADRKLRAAETIWFDVSQCFDAGRGKGVDRVCPLAAARHPRQQPMGNAGDYDTPEQTWATFRMERPWETCMTSAAVGLEAERHDEVAQGVRPDVGALRGRRWKSAPQRRPDARRQDRTPSGRSAQGDRALAGKVRREHLRHARRPFQAHQERGQHCARATPFMFTS